MFFNTDVSRRMNFSAVADNYERGRPGYPEEMYADLVKMGVLYEPGKSLISRCLEIGSGSGQATSQLLCYANRIDCIEPGLELCQILRGKFRNLDRVKVYQCDFEDFQPSARYELLFAASSLHWIEPSIAYDKSLKALAPGGWLVAVWNTPHLTKEMYKVCERIVSQYDSEFSIPGPSKDVVDYFEKGYSNFTSNSGFVECSKRRYQFRSQLAADRMTDFIWSYVGHVNSPGQKASTVYNRLLEEISGQGIDNLEVEYTYFMACGQAPC